MKLLTVKEVSKKWNLSERRIQMLCNENKIQGAVKFGKVWMIPEDAIIINNDARKNNKLPLPKKTPFLDMTNIYNTKGKLNTLGKVLLNNQEAYELFEAQIAYRKGEINKVYEKAKYFLNSHSGFYAILGGGMLLSQCAIWLGDVELWNEAKKHICEAPSKTKIERDIISLSLAIADSSIYDNKDYPEWFQKGNFEILPPSAHPAAKVFYIKYLCRKLFDISNNDQSNIQKETLIKLIPNIIEPLITQAVVDQTIIPEIYLRLSCAVAYYQTNQIDDAIKHIDKVLDIALTDGLYGILAEYIRHFNGLLEERISLINKEAKDKVLKLYQDYEKGWNKLNKKINNKNLITTLSDQEHKVAKLIAFGLSIEEISKLQNTSEQEIKEIILNIMKKTNILDIKEFVYFL